MCASHTLYLSLRAHLSSISFSTWAFIGASLMLKSAFMAAMADYRKQEYEKAGGGASKVTETLKRSNSR